MKRINSGVEKFQKQSIKELQKLSDEQLNYIASSCGFNGAQAFQVFELSDLKAEIKAGGISVVIDQHYNTWIERTYAGTTQWHQHANQIGVHDVLRSAGIINQNFKYNDAGEQWPN